MIIYPPQILRENDSILISSKLKLDNPVKGFPDFLWYKLPAKYEEFISLQSDAFLVAGLATAMHFGENIKVHGNVSPRLEYNLEEYMFTMKYLFPGVFQDITIEYDQINSLDAQPQGIGIAFSSGVDSLFTLEKHVQAEHKTTENQITHAIFIHHFDLLSSENPKFEVLLKQYQSMLKDLHIELIPIKTNQVHFILPWLQYNRFHSTILASTAMLLGKLFRSFIISSSWDYHQIEKHKILSNPLSDRLLSTEKLNIIHFGADYKRTEKIKALQNWEIAHNYLRVCAEPLSNLELGNCSRCEKCMRTMLPIHALGKSEQFRTFEKPIRSNKELLWWARKFYPTHGFVGETYQIAKEKRPEMLPWMIIATILGTIRYSILKFLPDFVKTFLKRFGYYHDYLLEENAFDDPIIIRKLESIWKDRKNL
ncbi:MAG: hypothetical protein JEZ06_04390 [Anaerolineaceae bacterium]|nr:hypothetical protein [Anaerolineaceae bacterium]